MIVTGKVEKIEVKFHEKGRAKKDLVIQGFGTCEQLNESEKILMSLSPYFPKINLTISRAAVSAKEFVPKLAPTWDDIFTKIARE